MWLIDASRMWQLDYLGTRVRSENNSHRNQDHANFKIFATV
jgi:hypothetical protein